MANFFTEYNKMISEQHRMVGPVTAARNNTVDEIADMRQKLATGIVEFEFYKKDPTNGLILRPARGTTCQKVIPTSERQKLDPNYNESLEKYKANESYIIWFWDLDKNAARCFTTNRFGKINSFKPVLTTSNSIPLGPDKIQTYEAESINEELEADKDNLDYYFIPATQGIKTSYFLKSQVGTKDPILTIALVSDNTMIKPNFNINALKVYIEQTWKIIIKTIQINWKISCN